MIRSNGRRWVSHPTDDEPAPGEQEDEIAMGESVRVGAVGLGRMGHFHAANLAGYGYECSSEILGHRGTLRIDNHRRVAVETLTPGPACQDYVSDFVERFADAYRGEMEHFLRVVRGEAEPQPSGADAAAATVLAQAAERSHRDGRTVRLKRETRDGEIFYEEAD